MHVQLQKKQRIMVEMEDFFHMGDNLKQQEKDKNENEQIKDMGQLTLEQEEGHKIHLMSIIGEVEGHETLSPNAKTTKYEHVLPKLAAIEDDKNVDGVIFS